LDDLSRGEGSFARAVCSEFRVKWLSDKGLRCVPVQGVPNGRAIRSNSARDATWEQRLLPVVRFCGRAK
jgi:hypothetical protein